LASYSFFKRRWWAGPAWNAWVVALLPAIGLLCGGGALLHGMDKLLTKTLGIPAYMVDNPATCTVEGAVKALGMYATLKRNLPPV
jgi:hypothetical protein